MRTKRRVKKGAVLVTFLILIFLVFGSLYAFNGYFKKGEKETPTELNKDDNKPLTYSSSFTVAGNVLMNSNMWYDVVNENNEYDFSYVISLLKDNIKKSNVNIYSQQSIIGGKDLGASLYYNYNSPIEIGDAMLTLGFNMVSLANYHAYDKGLQGITNSINYWNGRGVSYSGTSTSEENRLKNNTITKNGVTYALLSYTMGTDTEFTDKYLVNVYSEDLVKSDVDAMKKTADVIIVSIDWNEIDSYEVTEEQKEIANYLSSIGVSVVLGNTGYSIQPIEKINDTLVFYSLGNLLSGHSSIDSRIGMIADFNLVFNKYKDKSTVDFNNINVMLTYIYNSYNTNYKVVPFSKITNELTSYQTYYDKYKTLLTTDKDYINVYKIGE